MSQPSNSDRSGTISLFVTWLFTVSILIEVALSLLLMISPQYFLCEAACATGAQTQATWYGLTAVEAVVDEWGRVIVVFQQ
ncbi:hypothetical protein BO86DRAFT_399594 [Aspergillus japonicus CBS 114.51]|uniref:Uncharacterized protein n=1 Tax=Aspergillus japonicus CBS 114.51 TaxID=1448312 RepID=A0A8T8X0U8_ASPJA|nr:hypothetical protein BO86DRAFT_399594 [Aspergillus japonicus CBS 114.51]RAH81758.1 hypothetical protein BO86DRAFT_399594 [Aspergillus japonicus CBS 114.51]